jgi:predicted membrane protein
MRMTGRVWWGILLIVMGVLFILDEHSTFHISEVILSLWPLLIVGAGVRLLFRSRGRREETEMLNAPLADIGLGQRVEEVREAQMHMTNLFGNLRSQVESHVFRGGSLSTVFGNATVDLTHAELAEGEHSLKVDTVAGSVLVRVPRGMAFSVTADGVAGTVKAGTAVRNGFFPSVQFASDGYRDAPQRIHLALSTVFGEVRVATDGE